jgi:hypothetical protein
MTVGKPIASIGKSWNPTATRDATFTTNNPIIAAIRAVKSEPITDRFDSFERFYKHILFQQSKSLSTHLLRHIKRARLSRGALIMFKSIAIESYNRSDSFEIWTSLRFLAVKSSYCRSIEAALRYR